MMRNDDDATAGRTVASGPALPRTVVVLGLVSLLNDASSEMITPLLPIFLTATLGAGPAIVGLVEGLAEATASVLKLVAGRLADRGVKAEVAGARWLWTLERHATADRPGARLDRGAVLRFLDRVGKGLRTAPRDALIAAAAPASQRGRAFGFHRSMDHAGAVIGPLLAFALLSLQVELRARLPGVGRARPARAACCLGSACRGASGSLRRRAGVVCVAQTCTVGCAP